MLMETLRDDMVELDDVNIEMLVSNGEGCSTHSLLGLCLALVGEIS